MKRFFLCSILLSLSFVAYSDVITGTINNAGSAQVALLVPEVCGENVHAIRYVGFGDWTFNLYPPSGCSFCSTPPTEYHLSCVKETLPMNFIHDPGEPIAYYGPFYVNASCNYTVPEEINEITSGGFAGRIFTSGSSISIDSIMINVYHHYYGEGIDSYAITPFTIAPDHLTDIGGGTYRYDVSGVPSGAKKVMFFSDANNNNVLDPGERFAYHENDVPVVGHQYDDSVNISLTMLKTDEVKAKPKTISIKASPNPFNSQVEISVEGATPGEMLILYSLLGNVITEIPASGRTIWNGTDKNGFAVPAGVYFIALKSNREIMTKVWLIK